MVRSIEEVAIQLGVSKTSIYNKLKLKIYKDIIVKKQGKSMVDEELFNLNQRLNIELIEQLKEKDKLISLKYYNAKFLFKKIK